VPEQAPEPAPAPQPQPQPPPQPQVDPEILIAIGLDPSPPKGKSSVFKRSFHDVVDKVRARLGHDVPAAMVDQVYEMLLESLSRVLVRRTLQKGIMHVMAAVSMGKNGWSKKTDLTAQPPTTPTLPPSFVRKSTELLSFTLPLVDFQLPD
jgi:hypothetical protein